MFGRLCREAEPNSKPEHDPRRDLSRDFSFLDIPQSQLRGWGLNPAPRELLSPDQFMRLMLRMREAHAADLISPPLLFSGPHEKPDFTRGYDTKRVVAERFSWGRYDEDRRGMYTSPLFASGVADATSAIVDAEPSNRQASTASEPQIRSLHMGVDLGAPAGTPVFAPHAGRVWGVADREGEGDYGGVVILEVELGVENLWLLCGHLSRHRAVKRGDRVACGQLLGWLGEREENGGWNPHLHFQLSRLEPCEVDLPGAVLASDRELARAVFPDPEPWLKGVRCGA